MGARCIWRYKPAVYWSWMPQALAAGKASCPMPNSGDAEQCWFVGAEQGGRPSTLLICASESPAQLPPRPVVIGTQQAALPLSELPGLASSGHWQGVDNLVDAQRLLAQMPAIWTHPALPICLSQEQEGGWSIGWRWHPSLTDVRRWRSLANGWKASELAAGQAGYPAAGDGWVSANALDNSANWTGSPSGMACASDSRIELIFNEPQDAIAPQSDLARLPIDSGLTPHGLPLCCVLAATGSTRSLRRWGFTTSPTAGVPVERHRVARQFDLRTVRADWSDGAVVTGFRRSR